MSIFRVEKNANYVVMNRTALNDKNLSWKAKGIIAYMLSMPDDWVFYINELTKHSTDGEKSFRSGLKELKDNGYVKRKPVREGNKIVSWETIVSEIPNNGVSLLADFVQVENVDEQKDALLSTDSLLSTDNKYIGVFEHWNSKGIIKHKKANQQMIGHINARLEDYEELELLKAIDNYDVILKSDIYYWSHTWTLETFMKPNNVIRFLDSSNPFRTFVNSGMNQQLIAKTGRVIEDVTPNIFGG